MKIVDHIYFKYSLYQQIYCLSKKKQNSNNLKMNRTLFNKITLKNKYLIRYFCVFLNTFIS